MNIILKIIGIIFICSVGSVLYIILKYPTIKHQNICSHRDRSPDEVLELYRQSRLGLLPDCLKNVYFPESLDQAFKGKR